MLSVNCLSVGMNPAASEVLICSTSTGRTASAKYSGTVLELY